MHRGTVVDCNCKQQKLTICSHEHGSDLDQKIYCCKGHEQFGYSVLPHQYCSGAKSKRVGAHIDFLHPSTSNVNVLQLQIERMFNSAVSAVLLACSAEPALNWKTLDEFSCSTWPREQA